MKKIFWGALFCCMALQGAEPASGVAALSDGVRTLLRQEMRQIEQGMQGIFSAAVRGEYDTVAAAAAGIRDSFIFKKKLTGAQRKELKKMLPPAFIALDGAFHETAGELAAAAEFGETEKVIENYALLMQTCVRCHSTFARHRFSAFAE